MREDRNLGFRGGVKNKPINSSTIHPLNITSPSPAFGTLPRGVVVEPFTPHASRFTSRKAVIRIIRDVGKAWFSDTLRAGFAIAHTAPSRKSAFTLAEVLITLGIIGVVAAMTLPSLIGNYKKKQTVTQLKKSYTDLSQAVKMSELKNGSIDDWDYTLPAKEFFETYLSNNVSINKSTVSDSKISYKYLNGGPCLEDLCIRNSYTVFLADGNSLTLSDNRRSDGKVVSIDINGYKEPNTIGKDFFTFAIQKKYGLSPFGYKDFGVAGNEDEGEYNQVFGDYDRDVLTSEKSFACTKGKRGFWCAALIIMDGWEIKDDYPW